MPWVDGAVPSLVSSHATVPALARPNWALPGLVEGAVTNPAPGVSLIQRHSWYGWRTGGVMGAPFKAST